MYFVYNTLHLNILHNTTQGMSFAQSSILAMYYLPFLVFLKLYDTKTND